MLAVAPKSVMPRATQSTAESCLHARKLTGEHTFTSMWHGWKGKQSKLFSSSKTPCASTSLTFPHILAGEPRHLVEHTEQAFQPRPVYSFASKTHHVAEHAEQAFQPCPLYFFARLTMLLNMRSKLFNRARSTCSPWRSRAMRLMRPSTVCTPTCMGAGRERQRMSRRVR